MTQLETCRDILTHLDSIKTNNSPGHSEGSRPAPGPRTPVNVTILDAETEAVRSLRMIARCIGYPVPIKSTPPRLIATMLLRHNATPQIESVDVAREELSWLTTALVWWNYQLTGTVPDGQFMPMEADRAAHVAALAGARETTGTHVADMIRNGDVTQWNVNGKTLVNPFEVNQHLGLNTEDS